MTVCTHMCRGNFRSSWMAEGGYDHVAEALFGELAVDGFFLEYDDARSGGFAPLRFVPQGQDGSCSGSSRPSARALESKDELKRRIDEAAKYVPLEQLCLSPQCGFSSTVDGNALTIERAERQTAPRRRRRPRGLGRIKPRRTVRSRRRPGSIPPSHEHLRNGPLPSQGPEFRRIRREVRLNFGAGWRYPAR